MAVLTMTRLASERSIERSAPAQELVADDKTKKTIQDAIAQLVGFVPTPVVGAWAVVLGLLRPTVAWQRWALLGAMVLLLLLVVVLDARLQDKKLADEYRKENKKNPPRITTGRLTWMVGIAVFAFLLWAMATPGSPAENLGNSATRVFAVLAVVFAPIVSKVAELKDLVPEERT